MRSVRFIFIFSGLIAVIAIAVAAFLMFSGPDKIQVSGRSLSDLFQSGDLLGIAIIPIILVITALAILPFLKIIFPPTIKDGIQAQARVLKVWDTGVSINDNPQVGMLLEVTPLAGAPFQVEAKRVVSRLQAALVQPGISAEVVYDPKRPQRLQVVNLHAEAAETGASQAGGSAASRMEQLNELKTKGLITEEEFKQKREEILRSL